MLPKLDELCALSSSMKPEIIVVCETWLTELISDNYLLMPHYSKPARRDRTDGRKGGGVLIYYRQDLLCKDVTPPSSNDFNEQIWLRVSKELLLIGMYVPPSLSASTQNAIQETITEKVDEFLEKEPDLKLIIAGDLNQFPTSSLERDLSMKNVVDLPTRGTSILDKILVSKELVSLYFPPTITPNLGNSDHHTVFLKSRKLRLSAPVVLHKVYDYRESKLTSFFEDLLSYPWYHFYASEESLDIKCEIFHGILERSMSKIPFDYVQMTEKDKPWITPLVKMLINKRYTAFRNKQFDLYHHYKKKVKNAINESKRSWMSSASRKSGGLWKAVSSVTNKRKNNPIDKLSALFNSPIEAAENISDHFSKIFTEPPDWSLLPTKNKGIDWDIEITMTDVYQCLRTLKTGKATGSDSIPARLLRLSASVLTPPLTHLFCLSVFTRTFPEKWKLADVVPIPKKSHPSLDDLRPISKLPICSKILEKLVLTSVKPFLIAMYGDEQFGFRPKTSTLHAHIYIQEFITSQLDDPSIKDIIMISFDMSKAFDKLDHKCLANSLDQSNLPENFVDWCKSYLSHRKQRVALNASVKSSFSDVTSGVPQGAVLAPFLFAAHMGTLSPHFEKARIVKYADDIVTLIPIKSKMNVNDILTDEIRHLNNWCKTNGLELNDKKTKVMFLRKQARLHPPLTVMPIEEKLNVLGIIYEPHLKWHLETEKRCKKASQRLYALRQFKQVIQKTDLVQIHNNLILSVLEYCGPIFLGISEQNSIKLEKVQRRSHRIVCGISCNCDCFPLLQNRRKTQALNCFLSMKDEGHILHELFPRHLPSGARLAFPFCRTSLRSSSFIPSCITICNNK